ncbi:MAG: hypothetical protein U0821_08165 [Chloroflexota bacterium]
MSSITATRRAAGTEWVPEGGWAARLRWIVLVVLALATAPFLHLVNTGGAMSTGYAIQDLRAERDRWRMRNQQLELELAKAHSLAWIEQEAVRRLGMQRPSQVTTVRLQSSPPAAEAQPARSVNTAASPAPAAAEGRIPEWSRRLAEVLGRLDQLR